MRRAPSEKMPQADVCKDKQKLFPSPLQTWGRLRIVKIRDGDTRPAMPRAQLFKHKAYEPDQMFGKLSAQTIEIETEEQNH